MLGLLGQEFHLCKGGGDSMETVIASFASAIISAVAAIVVSVINSNSQHKKALAENEKNFNKMLAEIDKSNALQSQEIKQLTTQVEKHNKVIERVYNLEKQEAVIEEEIKVANHRIEDLEELHKKGDKL